MAILRVEPVRRIFVDADPTSTAVPGVAMPGDLVNYAGTDYVMTSGGVVAETSRDQSPVFDSMSLGAAPAAATSASSLVKVVTGIADNTATLHRCMVYARILNSQASGITIA
jgi:hypothetical protein